MKYIIQYLMKNRRPYRVLEYSKGSLHPVSEHKDQYKANQMVKRQEDIDKQEANKAILNHILKGE